MAKSKNKKGTKNNGSLLGKEKFVEISVEEQLKEYGYISARSLPFEEIEKLPKAECEVLKEYSDYKQDYVMKLVIHFTRRFTKTIFLKESDYNALASQASSKEDSFVISLPFRIINGLRKDGTEYYKFFVFLFHGQNGRKLYKWDWFQDADFITIELLNIPFIKSLKNNLAEEADSKVEKSA